MFWVTEAYALSGQQSQQAEGGSVLMNMLPFLLMFVVMYFLLIRPQYKKQKDQQSMIDSLNKGDNVVTNGGIHGTIVGVKEKDSILVVQVAKDVRIEVSRGAISRVTDKKGG